MEMSLATGHGQCLKHISAGWIVSLYCRTGDEMGGSTNWLWQCRWRRNWGIRAERGDGLACALLGLAVFFAWTGSTDRRTMTTPGLLTLRREGGVCYRRMQRLSAQLRWS